VVVFGHALDLRQALRVPLRIARKTALDGIEQADFFFRTRLVQHRNVFLGAHAQVQQQRRVAAVVQDHVGVDVILPFEDAVRVFPVFVQRLALDGEHGRADGRDGGSSMVLRRIDIARGPAHLRAQRFQRADQHGSLDGHVQRTGNARALQRLAGGIFLADGHQARHFGFRDADFLLAPGGQGQVGNEEIGGLVFEYGVHHALLSC